MEQKKLNVSDFFRFIAPVAAVLMFFLGSALRQLFEGAPDAG